MPSDTLQLADSSKNASVDAVCSGANGGTLELLDGFGTTLAIFTLQNPAFGGAAAGVATLNGLPLASAPAIAAGLATHYIVKDGMTNEIWEGSVGNAPPANIVMADPNIVLLQTVTFTAFTHSQPT